MSAVVRRRGPRGRLSIGDWGFLFLLIAFGLALIGAGVYAVRRQCVEGAWCAFLFSLVVFLIAGLFVRVHVIERRVEEARHE